MKKRGYHDIHTQIWHSTNSLQKKCTFIAHTCEMPAMKISTWSQKVWSLPRNWRNVALLKSTVHDFQLQLRLAQKNKQIHFYLGALLLNATSQISRTFIEVCMRDFFRPQEGHKKSETPSGHYKWSLPLHKHHKHHGRAITDYKTGNGEQILNVNKFDF